MTYHSFIKHTVSNWQLPTVKYIYDSSFIFDCMLQRNKFYIYVRIWYIKIRTYSSQPCLLDPGQEVLYSICASQVVRLTRDPQCFVPKQGWYSIYRPRRGERLPNRESNSGLAAWQKGVLTTMLLGLPVNSAFTIFLSFFFRAI